jgi:hypothetical protein
MTGFLWQAGVANWKGVLLVIYIAIDEDYFDLVGIAGRGNHKDSFRLATYVWRF